MKHSTRNFSLNEIMRMVSTGALAIPEFQRRFVWTPNQAVELLESVANGWPIGTLLMLEGPQPFRVKKIVGGPDVNRESVRIHLLDGQQRVTALYHALTDSGDWVYFVDVATTTEFEDLPRIRWAARDRFERTSTTYTIKELLSNDLMESRLRGLPGAEAKRIRGIRDSVTGYLRVGYDLPAIFMDSDIDLEALTKIFETLNRTGVRLDAFDLMVATLYPHEFNLRERWENAAQRYDLLKTHNTSGLEILKLIALWEWFSQRGSGRIVGPRAVTGVRQSDILKLRPATVVATWDLAVENYVAALEFLSQRCGVRAGNLPSSAMVLTTAFLLRDGTPETRILQWYWRSVVRQSYAQGANTQILTDVARRGAETERSNVREVLGASLGEPVRRSRILRLGLRGAAIVGSALDPYTGEQLSDEVDDIDVRRLLGFSSTAVSGPVVRDLVVIGGRSRRSTAANQQAVNMDALDSQGFDADLEDDASLLAKRVETIYRWIGEWL